MAWPSPGCGRFHGIVPLSLTGPTGFFSGGGTHADKPTTVQPKITQTKERIMSGG